MKRYYALLCADGKARLVKALDGVLSLAEADFAMEPDHRNELRHDMRVTGGAAALMCEAGRMNAKTVSVHPLSS